MKIGMQEIELEYKYEFTIPGDGLVNSQGVEELISYLFRLFSMDEKRGLWSKGKDILEWPDDWSWSWIIRGKGDYVGTLPKRISKYFHSYYEKNLTPEQVSEIGNISKRHIPTDYRYIFDFTDTFQWESGDFGDNGSCYWGSNVSARYTLMEQNAYAIRFYDVDDRGSGVARAWVVPQKRDNQEVLIVYNGYGFKGDPTLEIVRLLATWSGLNYKRIRLLNHGDDTGTLYINGGRGYVVTEDTSNWDSHDFRFSIEDIQRCYNCDHEGPSDEFHEYNEDWYCERCWSDRFGYCEECNETYDHENLIYVSDTSEYLCPNCFNQEYFQCHNCNSTFNNDEIATTISRFYAQWHFCSDCADELLKFTCACCKSEEFEVSGFNAVDGEKVCNECYRNFDRVGQCYECGSRHLVGILTEIDGYRLCQSCAGKQSEFICSDCQHFTRRMQRNEAGDNVMVCDRCATKHKVECPQCHQEIYLLDSNIIVIGNATRTRNLCNECLSDFQKKEVVNDHTN